METKVIVGFSGGVTSAWCAGWALQNYPAHQVVLLFHDTREEHPDTYRFIRQMSAKLGVPVTERSDGRSVTQLFDDEGMMGNNQNTMCSRLLKQAPALAYLKETQAQGFHVVKVVGMSAQEPLRIQKQRVLAAEYGYDVRFPVAETGITKQACAEWCSQMGVCPSEMYRDFSHANCLGCVKGGMAYWTRIRDRYPEVFKARSEQERAFGHTIIRGGTTPGKTRWRGFLDELPVQVQARSDKEAIELPVTCDCSD